MFIKISKSKKNEYVHLVESYRENGQSKHRILANLGRKDDLEKKGLDSIISGLQKIVKKKSEPAEDYRKDISTLNEINRFNYGYLAYRKLWNLYQLPRILQTISGNSKIDYDLEQVTFLTVVNQLLSPSSKLCLYNKQDHYFHSCEEIPLHIFYRALDKLADNKEMIEEYLFSINRNIFNMEVDVVFYDVTTYHFESQRADNLRNFGFSKAGKFNEVQVVMGLLIDKEGNPVGYELFPGNTSDSRTMVNILHGLQKRFRIDKLVIVADGGLNSKMNLKYIKDCGFQYIVRSSVRKMKKAIQQEVISSKGYEDKIAGEDEFKTKELPYDNVVTVTENGNKYKVIMKERLICSWSSKRERKDRRDRLRAIEKAEKLIEKNNKSALSPHGYKKYVKIEEKNETGSNLFLDKMKILEEEKFDGFSAIQCSDPDLSVEEIIQNYHYLFKIEESFRIMKSTFEARPVYVWDEKRIEGHFVCCFLAFLLERRLESKLVSNGIDFSSAKIKDALNSTELSEIEIENNKYFMKGKSSSLSKNIFRILKVKQPKNIQDRDSIIEYFS